MTYASGGIHQRFSKVPEGYQPIVIDDSSESLNQNDHQPAIKKEPEPDINSEIPSYDLTAEDNEEMDTVFDFEDFVKNTSPSYLDLSIEEDAEVTDQTEAGAERITETTTQEVSTEPEMHVNSSKTPTPITAKVLGSSLLGTLPQKMPENFLAEQAAFLPSLAAASMNYHQQVDSEPILSCESRYNAARDAYMLKLRNGEAVPDDDVAFSKLEHAYNKKRKIIEQIIVEQADGEDSLFVPEDSRKKKKAKRSKGNNHLDLDDIDIFGDTHAGSRNEQPTFNAGNNRARALEAIRKQLPKESQRAAGIDIGRINRGIKNFFGSQSVKPADGGHWSVRGMKTTLKSYQIINAGFMRGREHDDQEPRGGILADQMGLGKTVTCLANIVNGCDEARQRLKQTKTLTCDEARQRSNEPLTTLIVLPNGVMLDQWKKEIWKHCDRVKKRDNSGICGVFEFRNSMSLDSTFDMDDWHDVDIILTTYHDVMESWPVCEYPNGLTEAERQAYFFQHYFEKRGPLHRFHFLRIVLDEGHQIRNPGTRTSSACHHLIANHSWVLTGTPMLNGAKDLYNLLCFIGHPDVKSISVEGFKTKHVKDHLVVDGLKLLECMSRFTHNSTILDSRLLTLPKPYKNNLKLNPSTLEAGFIEIVRKRFKQRVQALDLDGDKTARLCMFVLLTMLRQLSAHILMIVDKVSDYLELEDFEQLEEIIQDDTAMEVEMGASYMARLRLMLRREKAKMRPDNRNKRSPEDLWRTLREIDDESDVVREIGQLTIDDAESIGNEDVGGDHGKDVNFSSYVSALKSSNMCVTCNLVAVDARIATCGHYYCFAHLRDVFADAARHGKRAKCVARLTKGRKKRCGQPLTQNISAAEDAMLPKWLDKDGNVLPSSKTLAIKSQLLEWFANDCAGKVIIFTQWLGFLKILEKVFDKEGWNYTILRGKMSRKARTANINKFQDDPDVRIFISTLKTGGQGLNLTCARYVINVDPYWNLAIEDQAFSRVYRIGQESETRLVNLVLANTVDERIKAIQRTKDVEIKQVIKNHDKLSRQELLRMFDAPTDSDDSESG
jgi:SNF2 family DNA or RNA helicase